jgi:hypothetical protein
VELARRERRAVLRCDILLVVAIAFIILTSIAMAAYPGSNHLNHTTHGYSFTTNFFSDLGATRTYAKHLSVASAVLFMIALAAVGGAIIVFSFNAAVVAWKEERLRRACMVATACGIVSGLGFICIAGTPENVSDTMHVLFVQIAFGFLLLFVILLTAAQIANHWPRIYLVPNFLYMVILAAYVVLLFFGPNVDTLHGLEIQAIGQKIIVYSSIVNVALQAFGVRRYLLNKLSGKAEVGAALGS